MQKKEEERAIRVRQLPGKRNSSHSWYYYIDMAGMIFDVVYCKKPAILSRNYYKFVDTVNNRKNFEKLIIQFRINDIQFIGITKITPALCILHLTIPTNAFEEVIENNRELSCLLEKQGEKL